MRKKVYVAASIGNTLEFYDFALYGFYAGILSDLFFPVDNPLNSLLLAYSVFAVGFLSRPLGAVLFGLIGDRFSRRVSLLWSLLGIAFSTVLIGFIPTYRTWGIMAPVCLTFLRIFQGICLGGEYCNSLVFVSEYLEKYRVSFPAFVMGSISAMGVLGWLLAALIGGIFNGETISTTSWRIPFLFGGLVGVVGYYIRKHTDDAYGNLNKPVSMFRKIKEMLRYPYQSMQAASIGILMGALFYGEFVFSYSFLPRVTTFSSSEISRLVAIGIFSYMLLLPLIGWLSDLFGHKKMILLSCILSFCLSPLIFYLNASGSKAGFVFSEIFVAFLLSALMAPGTYYMSLIFPSHIRCSGAAIFYNLGATLFGGTAPSLGLILYRVFETSLAPAIFLSFSALIAGFFLSMLNLS